MYCIVTEMGLTMKLILEAVDFKRQTKKKKKK